MNKFLWTLLALPITASGRIVGDYGSSNVGSGSEEGEEFVDVIVGFEDKAGRARLLRSNATPGNGRKKIVTQFTRSNAVAMKVPLSELAELEKDPDVSYIEKDNTMNLFAETVPWGISKIQGTSPGIPLPDSQADCFRVCVVDSGLMVDHPDIPYSQNDRDSTVFGTEIGIPSNQRWYDPASTASHGTHVTGVIMATGGNDLGIVGVIPNNKNICLMHARVFPDDVDSGQLESVIDAGAEWCADNGARVINMSLGGPRYSRLSRAIYEKMEEEGTLVIAAAGNYGSSTRMYPASYPTVMSVAAVDANMKRARFSQYNSQVDITAPGDRILSTVPGIGVSIVDQTSQKYDASKIEYSANPETSTFSGRLVDCGLGNRVCVGARGNICLIERGDITFTEKTRNCEDGGGIAAIIFNNEYDWGRSFAGSLGEPGLVGIPSMAMSQRDGQSLLTKVRRGSMTIGMEFKLGGYATISGTSMASPHVVGVAAKIWASRPACTNSQVRQALEATATYLGDPHVYGSGFVQAVDAYEYLLKMPKPCGFGTGSGGSIPEPAPTTGCEISSQCTVTNRLWLGDGECDGYPYQTEACCWDGGDCSPGNPAPTTGCEISSQCTVTNRHWLGDGECDGYPYQTEACCWDGGDCSPGNPGITRPPPSSGSAECDTLWCWITSLFGR